MSASTHSSSSVSAILWENVLSSRHANARHNNLINFLAHTQLFSASEFNRVFKKYQKINATHGSALSCLLTAQSMLKHFEDHIYTRQVRLRDLALNTLEASFQHDPSIIDKKMDNKELQQVVVSSIGRYFVVNEAHLLPVLTKILSPRHKKTIAQLCVTTYPALFFDMKDEDIVSHHQYASFFKDFDVRRVQVECVLEFIRNRHQSSNPLSSISKLLNDPDFMSYLFDYSLYEELVDAFSLKTTGPTFSDPTLAVALVERLKFVEKHHDLLSPQECQWCVEALEELRPNIPNLSLPYFEALAQHQVLLDQVGDHHAARVRVSKM